MAMGLSSVPGVSVWGWDLDRGTLDRARSMGILDGAARDLGELAERCHLVILAVPPWEVIPLAMELSPSFRGFVMDLSSVKGPLAFQLDRLFPGRYLGFHPMAGKETGGLESASGDLFKGAVCVLVPGPRSGDEAVALGRELASWLGARWILLGPQEHDRAAAVVSHLPMLISLGLMELARRRDQGGGAFGMAAGSFRDATRVSMSQPWLLAQVLSMNRGSVKEVLGELCSILGELASMDQGDLEDLAGELGSLRRRLGEEKGWSC